LNEDNEILKSRTISNIKTVNLSEQTTDAEKTSYNSIEFENKQPSAVVSAEKQPSNDFTHLYESLESSDKQINNKESEKVDHNIYFKERPEIDIFKAVFEDDDDDNVDQPFKDESDREERDEDIIEDESQNQPIRTTTNTILPSSFDKIDLKEVNKYLEHPKQTQSKISISSSDSSPSSSSSSSDSSVEIVYEEISIDNSSKKKHKKDKDKKKKSKKDSVKKKKSKKSKKSSSRGRRKHKHKKSSKIE
jgi:G patch domain-containing protein 1